MQQKTKDINKQITHEQNQKFLKLKIIKQYQAVHSPDTMK